MSDRFWWESAIAFGGGRSLLGGEVRSRFVLEGRSAFGRGAIVLGEGAIAPSQWGDRVFWEMSDRFWWE